MKNIYSTQSIFCMKHIWKVLLLVVLLYPKMQAEAQIKPLANGLPDIAILSCTNGNGVYVLTSKSTISIGAMTNTDTIKAFHWDGNSWTKLFSFFLRNRIDSVKRNQIYAMQFYNNELFLAGRFDSISNVPGFNNLMKWDGHGLISLGNAVTAQQVISGMIVYKNELIIAGNNYFGNNPFVYSWNGTRIMDLDSVTDGYEKLWFGHHLFIIGEQLYSDLRLNEVGKPLPIALSLWNGNYWEPIFQPIDTIGNPLLMNNDDILVITIRGVERWQSGSWHVVAPGLDKVINVTQVKQLISLKNTIWVLAQKTNFEDTTITTILVKWDGENWGKVMEDTGPIFNKEYNFLKSEEALYLYGWFKDFSGIELNNIGKISELAKFSGNVFYDMNSNCIKNAGDFSDNRTFISITPGALSTVSTDEDGDYFFYADSGTYNIKTIPPKYWKQTCTTNAITVHAIIDSVYKNNFPISPKYKVQDIRVTLVGSTGWRARQGFTEDYTLCYENTGTTTASGNISLLLDSSFTNFTSSPTALNYSFPVAEWKFDSLKIGEKRCITFKARLDSLAIDDSIKLVAAFDGGDGWIDSSFNDNIDTLKQRIVSSFDPNDKTSYPEGNITKNTKELRYQIRFQNTGTDTAYRVTIIDTVDTNLPLTKVMMNRIMLPDSNVNEPLSHGFINYTAQIKPGLAIGTEIKNTAYIYFDYQKPVITNTARSKMVEESVSIREQKTQSISSELHIWPNPASTYLNIKNDSKMAKNIQLVNILGQLVKTVKIQPLELLNLPVNDLKSGMYFIRSNGENTQKLIIE
ncbi:MAG: T9SS type A sorting domain-containing protein [Sphingobacteriales bacterium]|nr:MAG: T9SS type A sorting domain-containing protein [Sphingobacteriales bacterium]